MTLAYEIEAGDAGARRDSHLRPAFPADSLQINALAAIIDHIGLDEEVEILENMEKTAPLFMAVTL
jgi:hypothetical protein